MPRNVRLPNGVIIENVPDNVTREQVRQKAIETGRARPEDFEQAQAAPQPQTRRPAPTPPPEMMAREQQAQRQRAAEAAAYSQARSPSGIVMGVPSMERERRGVTEEISAADVARQTAREAGVDPQTGVALQIRSDLSLASPWVEQASSPAERNERLLQVANNSTNGELNFRIGPETGELEWQKPDGGWSLANEPGLDFGDVASAGPEAGILATGVVGGLTTGIPTAALTRSPKAAFGASALGEGVGEGLAQKVALQRSVEKGLIPEDADINRIAYERGTTAAAFSAAGGVIANRVRATIASAVGVPDVVVRALQQGESTEEAFSRTTDIQARTQRQLGTEEQPQFTLGQTAESRDIREAERAAISTGAAAEPLRDIQRQQGSFIPLFENQVLRGQPRINDEEYAELGRGYIEAFSRRNDQLRQAQEQAIRGNVTDSPDVATARANLFNEYNKAKEELFAPIQTRLESIQTEYSGNIDLAPVRTRMAELESRYSQDILRQINFIDRPLFKSAKTAGLESQERLVEGPENLLEWKRQFVSRPVSLREVQTALSDIRRLERTPDIKNDPQKLRIIGEVKRSLIDSRNESLPPQISNELANLEQQYARAMNRYNRGVVGEFFEQNSSGQFVIKSDSAVRQLLNDSESAQAFSSAVADLDDGGATLFRTRDLVRDWISERVREPRDGSINRESLENYLSNNQVRESLTALFGGEQFVRNLDDVSKAAEDFINFQNRIGNFKSKVSELLGINTTDPSSVANRMIRDGLNPSEINQIRNILPTERRELLDRAIATRVRDSFYDADTGLPNLRKMQQFLNNNEGIYSSLRRTSESLFGQEYIDNIRLFRDFLTKVEVPKRTVSNFDGYINREVQNAFREGVPALQGMARFLRVPFAPLAPEGRALSASVGTIADRAQRQVAAVLADPSKAREFSSLSKVTIGSPAFEVIAGRLGLYAFIEAKKYAENASSSFEENEDQGPAAISPTL